MGEIVVAIGSKDNLVEDLSLLARKWSENPKVVTLSGPALKPGIAEKASALFLDTNIVLALIDPDPGLLDDVKDHLSLLKEKINSIVYYTEAKPEVPAYLGSARLHIEQDREMRVRERVLSSVRARRKKMTDKAFALLKERVKDEVLLEQELDKLIDYAGDKDTIELKDVAAVVTQTHEDTLIALFEAIAQRNQKELIAILQNLLAQGVHILAIQNYLVRQLRLLLQAKDMESLLTSQTDYKTFSKALATFKESLDFKPQEKKHYFLYQKPYYAYRLSKTSMKFSKKELVSLLDMLAHLDALIKRGTKYDRVRLESGLLEV
ncbi:MAG TPA: hypothetical protein VMT71_05945 [Syntrophorhabdales bacterium]|nr:hypothetical protein [Syntrophorhabdales bacterium]